MYIYIYYILMKVLQKIYLYTNLKCHIRYYFNIHLNYLKSSLHNKYTLGKITLFIWMRPKTQLYELLIKYNNM